MPILTVATNVPKSSIPNDLSSQLSGEVARLLSKPESYVAVHIVPDQDIAFGGSKDPAALVTLGSIGGISSKQNNVSGKSLNSILSTKLGVSGSRIYINFVDLPAANVAHNGRTFG